MIFRPLKRNPAVVNRCSRLIWSRTTYICRQLGFRRMRAKPQLVAPHAFLRAVILVVCLHLHPAVNGHFPLLGCYIHTDLRGHLHSSTSGRSICICRCRMNLPSKVDISCTSGISLPLSSLMDANERTTVSTGVAFSASRPTSSRNGCVSLFLSTPLFPNSFTFGFGCPLPSHSHENFIVCVY